MFSILVEVRIKRNRERGIYALGIDFLSPGGYVFIPIYVTDTEDDIPLIIEDLFQSLKPVADLNRTAVPQVFEKAFEDGSAEEDYGS